MRRLASALRSPVTRWVFLGIAVALAVYAVWVNWDSLVQAAQDISPGTILAAAAASVLYVWLTLLSWRRVLTDLGSPLSLRAATSVFGVSQIGKYVPGGVWNIVAAAELGADHEIPRRRSVAAMAVTVLISIVSGLAIGTLAVAYAPAGALEGWTWIAWAAPVFVVLLFPPVTNRCIAIAFTILRRPPLETPLSTRGMLRAVIWAALAWVVAGLQVWLVAVELGMIADLRTFALAVGGYSLAWVVGFMVILVPAGAGAREGVLLAILVGSLPSGATILLVLVSRVLLTIVDLGYAAAGGLVARQEKKVLASAPREGHTRPAPRGRRS